MGHTNSTANLSLPQFIGTDKPTWLGDINSAFSYIDAYAGTNDAAVSGAVSDAASAVSQAASAVSTANAANTTAGNASTAATNAVGTANNAMSLVNQTNTKVGTLANLHTTDKTSIVNAINEIADGAGSVSVVGDGSKTIGQLLAELDALVDRTKISAKSAMILNTNILPITYKDTNDVIMFSATMVNVSNTVTRTLGISPTPVAYSSTDGTTPVDISVNVYNSGQKIEIVY